ncbi:enoyl-CoA hydratase/isomerase family protein [Pseudomonas sp. NPDC086251]|uniref:enoyl-CoA hydratase/isomerase family protein n=1 Tax=Pseudomonas sp. NPDC086251 TaxID=3364431 RepID=UPI003837FCD8
MMSVVREDIGHCAVLTLNRPNVLNAINNELLDELERHLDLLETDSSRALVLTGEGRAFCAGSDLNQRHGDPAVRMARMHRLVLRLQAFPKISVAAINGVALGGGLEVAMACTFRIALPGVRLGLPEICLGLIPAYGGTQMLPHLVGRSKALQMMLDGAPIETEEAVRIGLLDRLAVPSSGLLEQACTWAVSMGRNGLIAQQAIRRAVSEGLQMDLSQGLALELGLATKIAESADAQEGILAFVERRKPVFSDC